MNTQHFQAFIVNETLFGTVIYRYYLIFKYFKYISFLNLLERRGFL